MQARRLTGPGRGRRWATPRRPRLHPTPPPPAPESRSSTSTASSPIIASPDPSTPPLLLLLLPLPRRPPRRRRPRPRRRRPPPPRPPPQARDAHDQSQPERRVARVRAEGGHAADERRRRAARVADGGRLAGAGGDEPRPTWRMRTRTKRCGTRPLVPRRRRQEARFARRPRGWWGSREPFPSVLDESKK